MSDKQGPPEGPPNEGPDDASRDTRFPVQIEDEMRVSYLDYAMSVIVGRALPDVRDGLKPVHRRIMYAMRELGNQYNKPYKKSARTVGDVIGKYHPHGDSAVYDALVRLAQEFSMRAPLIDGQGNFGSVDGDPPAAMRYTEARLTKLASELLEDLDKNTVEWAPNFDDSLKEPLVLPAKYPNLLVNGSQGIAVGMATNIPPHNLREIVDGAIEVIRTPDVELDRLMEIIPGPDFPTGGTICGRDGIRRAYATGRGSIKIRAVTEIEERKKGGEQIAISELPYQVNKARLIERIAQLVGEKKVEGISDVRDESDRDGLRVVIELKRDANAQVTLNQLWSQTAMESNFGINMLAVADSQPRICTLKDALQFFVEHRREVVTRRTLYELSQAEAKFHVQIGLLAAIDNIDRVIEIIRGAPDSATAKVRLTDEKFPQLGNLRELVDSNDEQVVQAVEAGFVRLTEIQAQAILDLRLHRLTGLERDKLAETARELRAEMKRLREILDDEGVLLELIVGELEAVRDSFGNERRTAISGEIGVYTDEDLIQEEEMVVTISHAGYAKRTSPSEFRAQKRGGRGVAGAATKQEDFVERLFVASTHAYLLIFSDKGKVYWVKVFELPAGARNAKGRPLVNFISLDPDEKVSAVVPVREFLDDKFILTVSKSGTIKKTPLSQYSRPRSSGIIGAGIAEGDSIIAARVASDDNDLLLSSKRGMAIRFKASDLRAMGRPSVGVRGIRLDDGDECVGMAVLESGASLLSVTANGFGKRTKTEEYRVQQRGGRGIILIKVNDRNGEVVGTRQVFDDSQIMLITSEGVVIRMHCSDIPVLGRNTQGVRLVRVADEQRVQAVADLEDDDDEEGEPGADAS